MADQIYFPWAGGPCPVEPETRVFVLYRDDIISKVRVAGELRWEHENLCDDIVAFRQAEL